MTVGVRKSFEPAWWKPRSRAAIQKLGHSRKRNLCADLGAGGASDELL